jgi:hypothetical protein
MGLDELERGDLREMSSVSSDLEREIGMIFGSAQSSLV